MRALALHLVVFGAFLALSAAWTGPLIATDDLADRHLDLYPTRWLATFGPSTLPGLVHLASAWPVGESLAHADSYVLLALSTPSPPSSRD